MSEQNIVAAPVQRAERITNLDAVRGIAVLGILVMNAVSYGLPEAAYFNLDAAGSGSLLDWAIGVGGEIFVDQKMMALFSLLFGAGVVIFADRADAKGNSSRWLSLWRNVLLFGIGVLHAIVWEGDILTVYALCSPIVLVLRNRNPRALMTVGVGAVLFSALLAVLIQPSIPADGVGLGTYWFVDGGPIGDAAGLFLISDFFLRAFGMMLIGVALYRFGIVQGTKPADYYRRMARIGFGVGFPLAVAGVVLQFAADFSPRVAVIGEVPNTIATIPLAFGYLALIALWNQRPDTIWHDRVRSVGKMALTNYLTQTIIGIVVLRVILDRGDLNRTGIAVFILFVWAAQILWSRLWLRHFQFGPFEWAWRVATYRRFQPIRRP